jgi:protein SCO1
MPGHSSVKKLRIVLWTFAIMAILVAGVGIYLDSKPKDDQLVAAFKIGGPFSMTDHNGQAVTEKNYAGKALAVFFGFTYCPDVCPTTLSRLSSLMDTLGPDAKKIQVILVSVDPERDTPAVLKAYISAFDPRFVGLTGTPDQLANFAKSYRAFYEKVPAANGEYTMNHSAGVFLFDGRGVFQSTLDTHEKTDVVIKKLKRSLEN